MARGSIKLSPGYAGGAAGRLSGWLCVRGAGGRNDDLPPIPAAAVRSAGRKQIPIRGQVVRVAQVGLDRFILDDYGPNGIAYIVPRINDCILGGTADEGAEDLTPDPATAEAILARCIALEPRLREAAVLEHKVGLRPGRPTVRLEVERPVIGKLLVHNYGHGGAGVTLSWGCAAEVVRLVSC